MGCCSRGVVWRNAEGALCSPSATLRQVLLLQPLRVPSGCPQMWQGNFLGCCAAVALCVKLLPNKALFSYWFEPDAGGSHETKQHWGQGVRWVPLLPHPSLQDPILPLCVLAGPAVETSSM